MISGARSTEDRSSRRPIAKIPPLCLISSSLGVSGTGSYVFPCVTLVIRRVTGSNEKFVAVARVGDGLRALDDVQAEIEGVAAEDVAHVVAGDDDHLEAGFFRNGLEPGRRHLARGSDGKPIAGDDERLARVHARAEVGHQIAKRSRLPAFVQRVDRLSDTQSVAGVIWSVSMASSFLPG